MGSEWTETTLGELCERQGGSIQTGPFGSQLHASDYQDAGTPVVMPVNLVDGRVSEAGIARVGEAHVSKLTRHKLLPGDIVFSRRGDVTRFALITERESGWLCGTGCLKVSLGEQEFATAEFVAGILSLPESKEWLVQHAVGATMPNLNTSILSALPVRIPDLAIQRSATSLLTALTARMERLRQTNATLEAIAQTLFKSWFVDFDPVRAKAEGREPEGMDAATANLFSSELEDSELGGVPWGWKVQSLGSVAGNLREQAKPELLDPDTPYVGLEHMPRKSIALMDRGDAEGLASGKFWYSPCDILFGRLRPYFHKVGVAAEKGICSTDILVVRPHQPEWFGYCVGQFSSDALIAYATQVSNGARMPRVGWKDLAAYKVVTPPHDVAAAFDRLVRPMITRIHQNIEHVRTLANVRDTLLPRLISGKLRLPNAEHEIEAATA